MHLFVPIYMYTLFSADEKLFVKTLIGIHPKRSFAYTQKCLFGISKPGSFIAV